MEVWSDESGRRVATTTISSARGPEHCGLENTTFLSLEGGALDGDDRGTTFVGGPTPGIQGYLAEHGVARRALPDDAIDTGFHRRDRHLWLSPDGRRAYVGTRAAVASWPRLTQFFGCA